MGDYTLRWNAGSDFESHEISQSGNFATRTVRSFKLQKSPTVLSIDN